MKIYAPVKNANGIYASVRFVDGVGETNNLALIEWFKKHGYRVEKSDDTKTNLVVETKNEQIEVSDDKVEPIEPNFESMTPNELRDWAKANGLGTVIKNTRNKEKLLELIKEHRG